MPTLLCMWQQLDKFRGLFFCHVFIEAVTKFLTLFSRHVIDMTLAGLNDKLARRNFPPHNVAGVLIRGVYVGVRFPAHELIIFRNGLEVFFCPARPIRRCRLLGSRPNMEPVELISDSCSFFAVSSGFFYLPHSTSNSQPFSGDIFNRPAPELICNTPALKVRQDR